MSGGVVGRDAELRQIAALLDGARSGAGGAVVVAGDAGIGKTTLLEWATDHAGGLRAVRVTGVHAERDVPYAALHALLSPLATDEVLADLPDHQRDGLQVALGRAAGAPPGALTVGTATLGVLTSVDGLLVLVDDVQWVDGASQRAITFAARRVAADPVAFVMTERTGEDPDPATAGLPRIELDGIGHPDQLLPDLDPLVARRIGELVDGNPLALLEVARSLTPGQAAGTERLPSALPPTDPEEAYARRIAALPDATRRAARVLALAGRCPATVVHTALAEVGLAAADLSPLESSRLVRVEDQPWWVHPLARAAAGRGTLAEQQTGHRALATAWNVVDRANPARAWHLAEAATGPDDTIAELLVTAGEAAVREDASAQAADAFERAAALHSDPGQRHHLLERAAVAAVRAGWTGRAVALCDEALRLQPSEEAAGRLLHTRGRLETVAGDPGRAVDILLQAVALASDPAVRCWAAIDGTLAAMLAGQVERCPRFADLARAHHDPTDPVQRYQVLYAEAVTARFSGDLDHARALLAEASALLVEEDLLSRDPALTLLAVTTPLHAERDEPLGPVEQAGIDRLRLAGDLTSLPRVVRLTAHRVFDADVSYALREESELLSRLAGQTTMLAHALVDLAFLDAVRGDQERSEMRRLEADRLIRDHQIGWLRSSVAIAEHALLRERGDHVGALRVLRALPAEDRGAVLPELVELTLLVDGPDEARAEVESAPATFGHDQRRIAVALLEPDPVAAGTALAAVARELGHPLERGRSLLLAGERLRRGGRRREAREVLEEARAALSTAGAKAWVARAEEELAASGGTLRRESGEQLTPSELRVATVVADGRTNKEVAALLFLSTKTVEFHLGRAFRKLGVSNRTALAAALAARRQ